VSSSFSAIHTKWPILFNFVRNQPVSGMNRKVKGKDSNPQEVHCWPDGFYPDRKSPVSLAGTWLPDFCFRATELLLSLIPF